MTIDTDRTPLIPTEMLEPTEQDMSRAAELLGRYRDQLATRDHYVATFLDATLGVLSRNLAAGDAQSAGEDFGAMVALTSRGSDAGG